MEQRSEGSFRAVIRDMHTPACGPGAGVPGRVSMQKWQSPCIVPSVWTHYPRCRPEEWNGLFWSTIFAGNMQSLAPACTRLPQGLQHLSRSSEPPACLAGLPPKPLLCPGVFFLRAYLTRRNSVSFTLRSVPEVNCSHVHHHFLKAPRCTHSYRAEFGPNRCSHQLLGGARSPQGLARQSLPGEMGGSRPAGTVQ